MRKDCLDPANPSPVRRRDCLNPTQHFHIYAEDEEVGSGYDHPRFHWPRFWERVLSSLVNAVLYGGGIVLLRALGLL